MAIPDEALRLKFDPDELTLDEQSLFFERDSSFKPSVFKAFLKKYGNWTAAQLNALVRKDIATVYAECIRQLAEALVPKAKS